MNIKIGSIVYLSFDDIPKGLYIVVGMEKNNGFFKSCPVDYYFVPKVKKHQTNSFSNVNSGCIKVICE